MAGKNLTPEEIRRIKHDLRLQALGTLLRGRMQSARMLVGHDGLGPTLALTTIIQQLREEDAQLYGQRSRPRRR